MRKYNTLSFLLVLAFCQTGFTQKDLQPSHSFEVTGEVKSAVTFQASDLARWPAQAIGDVIITNHLGEKKSEANGLKGILLKDVLQKVELNNENPRVLSEYYFVCKANDGYTVVYSWNELFNSPTGNSSFIVTEKGGKSMSDMTDSILMISTSDLRTGRRHLKALSMIEVRRAR